MTKVIQIQIFTHYTGRAALRLHRAFLNSGIDSRILSLKPALNDDEKVIQKGRKSRLVAILDNQLQYYCNRNNIKEFGSFSYPVFGSNVSLMPEVQDADYIYIHWVLGGFLNLTNIEQIMKLGKPVIFFMHDMWSITGGCHYSFDCEKYTSSCFNCQILPTNKRNDLSSKGFEKKLKLYSKYRNLYFVSPSKWLYGCAKQSLLTKNKPNFHIPNTIDNDFFKPIDKHIAKDILDIGRSEIVIAFGAISIDNPYKGLSYLLKSLKFLFQDDQYKNILVLMFGSGYKKEIDDEIPFRTKFVGHLSDESSTVIMYNAADVFIAPSLADNLPTTILESLSCGTPVVGFDIGGIPDMIRHKENGYLAKYRDALDLSEGIKFCLKNNIKGYNLPDFEPQTILNRHLELFQYINVNEEKK